MEILRSLTSHVYLDRVRQYTRHSLQKSLCDYHREKGWFGWDAGTCYTRGVKVILLQYTSKHIVLLLILIFYKFISQQN